MLRLTKKFVMHDLFVDVIYVRSLEIYQRVLISFQAKQTANTYFSLKFFIIFGKTVFDTKYLSEILGCKATRLSKR